MVGNLTKLSSLLIFLSFFALSKEISPSILMFHEWDIDDCPNKVERALKFDPENIHFLVTAQFLSDNKNRPRFFCINNTLGKCEYISENLINRIFSKLETCVSQVPKSIHTQFSFHLNDRNSSKVWRNYLLVDPIAKYNGWSYQDILITPLIQLVSNLNRSSNSSISMQGEMGASVFKYPLSWLSISRSIKKSFKDIEVGVSLNFNKLNGNVESYSKKNIEWLISEIDFLGFSAYGSLPPYIFPRQFNKYVMNFRSQLRKLNIDIKIIKKLQFSEIGLGGGNWINDGKTMGTKRVTVAGAPYAGIYTYDSPINPWNQKKIRHLRKQYYKSLAKFLRKSKLISRAFSWSTGSWDIHGVYNQNLKYQDKEILDAAHKR